MQGLLAVSRRIKTQRCRKAVEEIDRAVREDDQQRSPHFKPAAVAGQYWVTIRWRCEAAAERIEADQAAGATETSNKTACVSLSYSSGFPSRAKAIAARHSRSASSRLGVPRR